MKYLGIDFGTKKLGLANSDDDNRLAFPIMILPNDTEMIDSIIEIVSAYKITDIVMGESIDNKGIPNPVAKTARNFANSLELKLNGDITKNESQIENNKHKVNFYFEKEWYSSVEARRVDGERDVDDRAAAIILQRYLDRKNGPIDHIDSDEEE